MSDRFGRVWRLDVTLRNKVERFDGMRMVFSARYGRTTQAHGATVVVSNPAASLVGALAADGAVVRVLAGYDDRGPIEVVRGPLVTNSLQDRRGAMAPSVSFQLSPSSAALQATDLSTRFAGAVRASQVLRSVAGSMGVSVVLDLADDVLYRRGYSATGSPSTVLDALAADCGCRWSIDGGQQLVVWPTGRPASAAVEVWTPSSGLLETQAQAGNGQLRAVALLRPNIRPGASVRIESPRVRGTLIVEEVTHQGDTHGTSFTTTITGKA